jgi:protease prsW family protein
VVFSFWPSLTLLAFFLVIFLECRVVAGRVTMPLGGFVPFFAYGCVGAALFSLLLQQLWFLQFAPVTNALGARIWPAAWWVGPPIEELAKILPVILLAFMTSAWRRLSIADLTLAGFASGAGFGFVEANLDALATGKLPGFQNLFAFGYQSSISLAGDYGVYFAGHAVYPALFALACGIGLRLYPVRQATAWIPGAAIFLICCFDHGMYNWKILHPTAAGGFADAATPLEYLYLITLHGRIEVVLLAAGAILAQLAEARLCTQILGRRGDLLLPYEFGRWVVNEWTVALMRIPFGCAAFDQTLAYFRRRRAFMLASLEVHRTPANRTLVQYTLLLEQRLLQERALLAAPPKGTWFPPRATVERNLLQWAWRVRFILGFGFLFVLLFMLGTPHMPSWLHDVLFSDLFTFAMVEGGLCFAAWRVYGFLHGPALDPVACEGAAYADHHMRILLLSVSLACGISPALSILFGWKAVAPGAAYLSGYFSGWIGQGGNLYSVMGLGAMGGAMEAEAGPVGGALRDEIEAGAAQIRHLERQIQKKIALALPNGERAATVKLEDLVALTGRLDIERDMQGRRIRALKALERQDAEGRVDDFGAAIAAVKQEFEQLRAEFDAAAGEERRRITAFEQGFNRYLTPILQEVDDYGASQYGLRATLADLWRPRKDLAWALRVAQSTDEAPFDALKDFVADLERIARQASGDEAETLEAAIERIRKGPVAFARPEAAAAETGKPEIAAAEPEVPEVTPPEPEEEPEPPPREPEEDQEPQPEGESEEAVAAADSTTEREAASDAEEIERLEATAPPPAEAIVAEFEQADAVPLGAADATELPVAVEPSQDVSKIPEPDIPAQAAAPMAEEVWFIEPALLAPQAPPMPHAELETSEPPPPEPRLHEAFDIEWVTAEEQEPASEPDMAPEQAVEPEVQEIAFVAVAEDAPVAFAEHHEAPVAARPDAPAVDANNDTAPAEAPKKESAWDALNDLVKAIKDDLFDHLGIATPPAKTPLEEPLPAPEPRAEPEDARALWTAPALEDASAELAREYLPAESPEPKEPERQTPLSAIAPGWSLDEHDSEHPPQAASAHADGHDEDDREIAFSGPEAEEGWHAHLKEFVDLPRRHAPAQHVVVVPDFEPDLPRIEDKTVIAAYVPVSTALPEPKPENYFTAEPDLPRIEDKTGIAAYVPVSTALPEPKPENYFTAEPDLPRIEDKTGIAAYIPVSTDLPPPRPVAQKDASKGLGDILSKLHKLEAASKAAKPADAKPAAPKTAETKPATSKTVAPPAKIASPKEQPKKPEAPSTVAGKPAAAAPTKTVTPPGDDGLDLWRQTVEGFDVDDGKLDGTDTGLRTPFEAKLPPAVDKSIKSAQQDTQTQPAGSTASIRPTKFFGVPKPVKPEPKAPETKTTTLNPQPGSASFRPTKFYANPPSAKADAEPAPKRDAPRPQSGNSTSIRSSKFYNGAKSSIDEADKTPMSATSAGSSTKSPLAEALNEYFAKSGETPPPMHTVDTDTLTEVINSGRLETTRKGTQPWTYSGIPRRGDYAIRLKRGSDRYVEFVSSNVTFGQTPRYYPRRVGVGTAQTYIPIDHLEYFDSGTHEWLPMKS